MQVQDVMTREVELIDPNTTIRDAAKKMREEDVGALPVGEKDRLVGMITDRDIVMRAVAVERSPANTMVRDVMSEKICYCFEDESLEQAAKNMADHQVKRLAVLNRNKRLVGMLALADLGRCEPNAAQIALRGISKHTGEPRHMAH
jgi:CBS domain-containing protein